MNYYIQVDQQNKIIGWCKTTSERTDISIDKDDFDILESSEDWHYTYENKNIIKYELSDAEKADKYKPEAIQRLSVITSSRINTGSLDYNGISLKLNQWAYDNYTGLLLAANTGSLSQEARDYASAHAGIELTDQALKDISTLLSDHKTLQIDNHDKAETQIMSANRITAIDTIIEGY
jgi:hypothetical protein